MAKPVTGAFHAGVCESGPMASPLSPAPSVSPSPPSRFGIHTVCTWQLAGSSRHRRSRRSPCALAAVLFGAMAGVEAPNPGAAEPVQRQHQQPLSLILKTVPAGISKIVLKWIPGEWHLISRTGSFNNQVMSPLHVHVRGLRQRPSDQPSRAICDPSTPSRLGRGRPPPAAPLTSPPR